MQFARSIGLDRGNKVKQLIVEVFMQDLFLKQFAEALEKSEEICMSDEFRSYQEWDSLAILSLLASIDEEYSVNINSAELEKMKTVGDVCKRVLDKS